MQPPGFVVSVWFGKLAHGALCELFWKSTHPDLSKTPRNSWIRQILLKLQSIKVETPSPKVAHCVFWCAATSAKLCFRKRPKFYNKRIRAVHGELLIPSSRVRRRWEGSKSLENWYKVRTTHPKQETTFVIVTNVHFRYFLRETRALWQFSEQHPEARLFWTYANPGLYKTPAMCRKETDQQGPPWFSRYLRVRPGRKIHQIVHPVHFARRQYFWRC